MSRIRTVQGLALVGCLCAVALVRWTSDHHYSERTAAPELGLVGYQAAAIAPQGSAGFGYRAVRWNATAPPDSQIAVGPRCMVIVTNGNLSIHSFAGQPLRRYELSGTFGFWRGLSQYAVFDPAAVFDPHSQRFILIAAERTSSLTNSYLLLAASTDADATGWHKYRFDLSNCGAQIDYPCLGVNEDTVTVSATFSQPFGTWLAAFEKAPLLLGEPPNLALSSLGTKPVNMAGVVSYDADAPKYVSVAVLSTTEDYFAALELHAIADPFQNPQHHTCSLAVPPFPKPNGTWTGIPQMGSQATIDARLHNIKSAILRRSSLWFAHCVLDDNRQTARVRWYEVALNGWPNGGQAPALVQTGTLNYGPSIHTFLPSINVDASGNAAIVFNRSSLGSYVSVQGATRAAGAPQGTFSDPVTLKVSDSPYPGFRWGDYCGIAEHPLWSGIFWSHNEYVEGGQWSGWVNRLCTVTPDCNGNSVDDSVDIATGTSVDCNGDLIPDECLALDDCDGNGIIDECQPGPDCNENNIVDVCELAASDGALLEAFPNPTLSGTPRVRRQTEIDAYWGNDAPFLDYHPDDFSVRWRATLVTPDVTGDYSFFVTTRGSVRLRVNGTRLVDAWPNPAQHATELGATATLQGNRSYPLSLEYYPSSNLSGVRLEWEFQGHSRSTIGPEHLRLPDGDCNLNEVPDSCEQPDCNWNGRPDACDIVSGAGDMDGDGIPDACDGVFRMGDLNCDGAVNFVDIAPFLMAMDSPEGYASNFPNCGRHLGDCNGDGTVDGSDVNCFVSLLGH